MISCGFYLTSKNWTTKKIRGKVDDMFIHFEYVKFQLETKVDRMAERWASDSTDQINLCPK